MLQFAGQLPMRLEERPMHLVELTVLARELRCAKRLSRVDQDIALFHDEAHLIGDVIEAAPHLVRAGSSEIRLARYAFDRRLRMQLEWEPRQVNEAFLLQSLDSDRVDVAPGSNVIGEDDQIRGRRSGAHRDQPTGAAGATR